MKPDLIIVNGDVRTMAQSGVCFEALAASEGRIVALGETKEIKILAGPETILIDVEGKTVLPGFIDAHCHLGLVAQSYANAVDCRTPSVRSVVELLQRASDKVRQVPAGTWILLQGTTFQDQGLTEKRFPTSEELTDIAPEHPVVYRSSFHHTIANKRAMELARIDSATLDPPSGRIYRDSAGNPTGEMAEMFDRFPFPTPTDSELSNALTKVGRQLVSHGVTSVQEIWDSPDVLRMLARKVDTRAVPLRIRTYGWVPLAGSIESIAEGGMAGVTGEPDWFEYGGVKLFADGGTSSHTAAFYEDYLDRPGTSGELVYDSDELFRIVCLAHSQGAQIMVHAAGDRAYDAVLDAFERALAATPNPDARHRIEHGANVAWSQARTARCLDLGVLPVPNVGFIRTYGEFWEQALGAARARPSVPLRALISAGLQVPGTSDTTGGDTSLLEPLRNMATALDRLTLAGRVIDPDERLHLDEALLMYTRFAAYAGRVDESRGTLELGKLADIVVLSARLVDSDPEPLKSVSVQLTIVGGEIRYSAGAH